MYSNKENVNILTSLLVAHGVKHVVVCPGRRDAPLVNNFIECPDIEHHVVHDERSAGYFAIGMILATQEPTAVCVDPGAPLLDIASAASEAYCQHLPLLIISADNSLCWAGQYYQQGIRQDGALAHVVKYHVTLPEPHNKDERWHCNRLVNEAILALDHHGRGPVHINVPISDPLYDFSKKVLPKERVITRSRPAQPDEKSLKALLDSYKKAKRPLIIIGQSSAVSVDREIPQKLRDNCVVVCEPFGADSNIRPFDAAIRGWKVDSLHPDFVLYTGGMILSESFKYLMRSVKNAEQWLISETGEVQDTSQHLTGIIESEAKYVLPFLAKITNKEDKKKDFSRRWGYFIDAHLDMIEGCGPTYSIHFILENLNRAARRFPRRLHFHFSNGNVAKIACEQIYRHAYCNCTVNSRWGTLSTAFGYSVGTDDYVVCVIDDMRFFSDVSALRIRPLNGNIRILLLNRNTISSERIEQGEYDKRHLEKSLLEEVLYEHLGADFGYPKDFFGYTSAALSAEGICHSYGIQYHSIYNIDEVHTGINTLLDTKIKRPVLLEVFFDD